MESAPRKKFRRKSSKRKGKKRVWMTRSKRVKDAAKPR